MPYAEVLDIMPHTASPLKQELMAFLADNHEGVSFDLVRKMSHKRDPLFPRWVIPHKFIEDHMHINNAKDSYYYTYISSTIRQMLVQLGGRTQDFHLSWISPDESQPQWSLYKIDKRALDPNELAE